MKYFIILSVLFFCMITSTVTATQYKYDDLHRLQRVVYNNGMEIVYSYDEVGNRTQRIATNIADSNIDGDVNLTDFAELASKWMETNCDESEWCNRTDYDWNKSVGFGDLIILVEQWLNSVPL